MVILLEDSICRRMTLGYQKHTSRASDGQFHIQQCPLNYVFRNIFTRVCFVLDYQMSPYLIPMSTYYVGQSLTSFFFDDSWTTNDLVSTASFTIIYPFFINTNNSRLQTIYQIFSCRDTCSKFLDHCNLPMKKWPLPWLVNVRAKIIPHLLQ